MDVVVRFPPSPTGDLHIGGARTALFNWAFARHHGGRLLLRFEDTDRARSSREFERAQLEALEWLGVDWDPVPGFSGIPRQSERLGRYSEAVGVLLESGAAYRCTCTTEEVEAMRERARAEGRRPRYDGTCRERALGPEPGAPFCVRVRVTNDAETRWTDLLAGPSGVDHEELDDFIVARTDGTPVYHMAVVIDDHDMGVTHVLRGREHLTSTPRQLILYHALGYTPPEFAHVPLLVDPSGKKLSKRDAAVSVQSYRDAGYPPEAVANFIARLGWGHGDLEIFSRDELARHFTLDGVGRSPSQVHDDKLRWLSQHYLKTLPFERLWAHLHPFLERAAGRPVRADPQLEKLVELLRERSKTLVEMAGLARFALVDTVEIEPKAHRKHLKPAVRAPLIDLRTRLEKVESWAEADLRGAFEAVLAPHELTLGKLAQPVRVAVTGATASPGIFETLDLLGRDRTLQRLDAALKTIE